MAACALTSPTKLQGPPSPASLPWRSRTWQRMFMLGPLRYVHISRRLVLLAGHEAAPTAVQHESKMATCVASIPQRQHPTGTRPSICEMCEYMPSRPGSWDREMPPGRLCCVKSGAKDNICFAACQFIHARPYIARHVLCNTILLLLNSFDARFRVMERTHALTARQ